MPNTPTRQAAVVPVDLALHPCPACGSTERWDAMHAEETADHNPVLVVWCDCGQGELQIIVE